MSKQDPGHKGAASPLRPFVIELDGHPWIRGLTRESADDVRRRHAERANVSADRLTVHIGEHDGREDCEKFAELLGMEIARDV